MNTKPGRSAHSRRVVLSLSVLPRAAGYLPFFTHTDWHLGCERSRSPSADRPVRGRCSPARRQLKPTLGRAIDWRRCSLPGARTAVRATACLMSAGCGTTVDHVLRWTAEVNFGLKRVGASRLPRPGFRSEDASMRPEAQFHASSAAFPSHAAPVAVC